MVPQVQLIVLFRFLGELKTPKRQFEINWPLVYNKKLKNIVLKVYFIHCRYLLPEKAKGGKQKTGVCRKTVCPKWEHTMAWDDISLDALWDRSLELTVWDHDRLGHNEILGGVRFNLGKGMS